jgi:Ca2+-transporting ATPase
MERPPRNPRDSVFVRRARMLMLVAGAWSALANLALFNWAIQSGSSEAHARTLVFVSLIAIQLVNAYNFRSDHASVFSSPFANTWLNVVIVGEVIVLVAMVALPRLQSLFGTQSLSRPDWIMVAIVSLSSIVVLELAKWLVRREVGWFA